MTPFLAIFLALITALVAGVPDEQAGESTIRVNPAIMEQSGMQFCGKRLHRAMRDLCRGNYAEFRVRSVERKKHGSLPLQNETILFYFRHGRYS